MNMGGWEAFLGACRVHGNASYGEIAAKKLVEIESNNILIVFFASTVGLVMPIACRAQ